MTLQPGESTTFSVTFTPPGPDTDYVCDFVVNSNDPMNPAYYFHASGRSTQWHWSKVVASSTNGRIVTPQLFIDGSLVYLTYTPPAADLNAIAIRTSTSGGLNWSSSLYAGQFAGGAYPHLLTVTGESANASIRGPHAFYFDGSNVRYIKHINNAWRDNLINSAANAGIGDIFYGNLLLSGLAFVTWYDSSVPALFYTYSTDP